MLMGNYRKKDTRGSAAACLMWFAREDDRQVLGKPTIPDTSKSRGGAVQLHPRSLAARSSGTLSADKTLAPSSHLPELAFTKELLAQTSWRSSK
jgi:hypothetical protein